MIVMPACFNSGDTIYFPFDTYDSNGASVTITGLAVTDIEIYKDGSVTQRSSDNGYTLLDTDGIDFDGTTGLHGFSVDTSDNSDAGFYADGSQYWVNINAITVDGQTVRFTYYLPLGLSLRPTTAGRTLDVASTGEAGVDLGNVTGVLGQANVGWVDANSRVDVGSWLGTAVTTSATSAKPEVDAFSIDDSETAATAVMNTFTGVGGETIDIGTLNVSSNGMAWNAAWDTEVQSEVNDGLVALGLDHLVGASVTGTDVTDNSIIAKLVSASATADWDDFVNTTESLQALRDRGDSSWITATGFSTHDAAAVWTSGTRTLTATGLDLVLVDGKTLPNALEITAAAAIGKISGAGTGTETFVGLDGATTRATVTVDASGNRSAVVYA